MGIKYNVIHSYTKNLSLNNLKEIINKKLYKIICFLERELEDEL